MTMLSFVDLQRDEVKSERKVFEDKDLLGWDDDSHYMGTIPDTQSYVLSTPLTPRKKDQSSYWKKRKTMFICESSLGYDVCTKPR